MQARDRIELVANREAEAEARAEAARAAMALRAITVSYGESPAVFSVDATFPRDSLIAIVGPNGAGKSTMMDIITGKTRPDTGSVWFGQTLNLLNMSEPDIAGAGIGRKFQKPTVFENHSVFHNLDLAMAGPKDVLSLLRARLTGEEQDRIEEILTLIGLADERHRPAGVLSHGQKQWLEIGMLLMQKPRLLLIDEPVAGMTHQEMDRTGELVTSLAGEHSVVVVEHDMDFVRSIASKVTVLHQGHVLAEGSMDDIQRDPNVVHVYLGEAAC